MERVVESVLASALSKLRAAGKVPESFAGPIAIERPRREEFGDYGCALPLALAKAARRPPAECGRDLIAAMELPEGVFDDVNFAPPGYVNFKVRPAAWFRQLRAIAEAPGRDGVNDAGRGE